MNSGEAQQKTEKATPRKLQQARRKGQVAKSVDLSGALTLLAVIVLFYTMKDTIAFSLQRYFITSFTDLRLQYMDREGFSSIILATAQASFGMLAPVLIIAAVAAVAVNIAQVGFLFSGEALRFKPEVLNPVNGFKRMFSSRSILELAKSCLKLAILGTITWRVVVARLPGLVHVCEQKPVGVFLTLLDSILAVLLYCGVAYVGLGLLDYLQRRYEFNKEMRMSKQELKDELKHTEGDPMIKARQRERMRTLTLNRIRQEVPRATVVITNPVHLALALRYQDGETDAPRLIAKGAGRLAELIKKIANDHYIPIIENKEVARILYQRCELGQEIPVELYQAVAEIIALVYRLRGKNSLVK